MDLRYSTEQEILRDSAKKFFAAQFDYQTFRTISESDLGFSQEIWMEFAKLGWLGLPFSLKDGGSGAGAVELSILMEAFGGHLVLEPYLSTVVLGGGLLGLLGSSTERSTILPAVIDGQCRLAFAYEDEERPTTAVSNTTGYTLRGRKRTVLGAAAADILLVSAEFGNGKVGIFKIDKGTRSVSPHSYSLVDGSRAATINFDDVALPSVALIGGNEDAGGAIRTVIDHGIAALSADAVGAIAAIMASTLDYVKTRVQFGKRIADFQAIQHRLVEMKIREEEARAASLFATLSSDSSTDDRLRAVSGAKAKVGRCAQFIYQNAIQLHGGIGTTKELALGGYAKRLIVYEIIFGSTRQHLKRYANLIARPEMAASSLINIPAN